MTTIQGPIYSVGGASELEVKGIDKKARLLMKKYNLSKSEARRYAESGRTPKKKGRRLVRASDLRVNVRF